MFKKIFAKPIANTLLPHHLSNGRFQNIWGGKFPSFMDMLKWGFQNRNRNWKNATIPSEKELPIVKPNLELLKKPKADLQITWLGHVTFLIQTKGVNILTDPVFYHASPFKKITVLRIREPPLQIRELPKIDFTLISHNHYDHLDCNSIAELKRNFYPKFVVPLKLGNWFTKNAIYNVTEMDWWNEIQVTEDVKITFLPAQHWSRRGLFDKNKTLWGSFLISTKDKKVYFSGDSGYCPVFKEIGEKFGPIDIALLPIGAYAPRFIMKYSHMNIEESVQVSLDIKAKRSIGMHWGTFKLTDEPIMEPKILLEQELKKRGLPNEHFHTLKHGETLFVD